MLLVFMIYLVWAERQQGQSVLLIEALFVWLALFVPPLILCECALALVRRLLGLLRLRLWAKP